MAFKTIAPVLGLRPDDDKAFERLYERHVRDVYRYAAAMLGEAADAEDVTQTTFLNAYRAFQSGTRPEKPRSWLIAIAHNVCRQRFRQAQRRPHEVAFDERIGEREAAAESIAPSAEDLRRALSQLPPNQRAAIVMRELEGGSYTEIAEVLGTTVSALETLLFRARRALREQLEEQLTCQQAALAINKQLDGRLAFGERRGLRAHLRACAECNSLAQSQRAQRRALKALVLVPLPATVSHWMGSQSAAAATGAGAVVGGGTYEGVRLVEHPAARNAQPPAARVEFAAAKSPGIARGSDALMFETPKLAAPIVVEPSPGANARALRAVRKARSVKQHAPVVPPGQTVKALAQTPATLRSTPPGLAVKAATPASAHAQTSTGQSRRRTPSHPVRPIPRAKPKPVPPALPVVPRGRQTPP